MWKITIVIITLAIGIGLVFRTNPVTNVPNLPETFWGPEINRKTSNEVRPFLINVTDSVIHDLKNRLAERRESVPPLENVAWTYGTSTTYLEEVLEYWRTKYNWTERQTLLNRYPQYVINIQGLDVHFYHVKPRVPSDRNLKVVPLLILHGWPGSVVEFQRIIPMLTSPRPDRDFVFEVIAPSLPGYGFSQAAVRPGLGPAQMSVIMKNLMLRLGLDKFYAQGGDWGSGISTHLARFFPDNVLGLHMNFCVSLTVSNTFWRLLGSVFSWLVVDDEHYHRMYPLSYQFGRAIEETGYLHIQATKPDTIGTAVAASPVGLAAYMLEKFSTGTNEKYRFRADGGLLEKHAMDELLDNIMIYWITNSMTTSMRIYAEHFNRTNRENGFDNLPVNVPSACAAFPHEILFHPESLLRSTYTNLIQYNHLPRGGHFAAMEEPALLMDDIFEFVSKVEETLGDAERKMKGSTKI